jgi:hypothetical protein
MEAFALAILGADDDPVISRSTCGIIGFYRPASIGKKAGDDVELEYGFDLYIKMPSYTSLDDYLTSRGGASINNIRSIINDTAEKLLRIRDKYNFIHCDLHKGNVLFHENGDPVLIDFGRVGLTLGSTFFGTNVYAKYGFSYDMILYVMSLYCNYRHYRESFRAILMYKEQDMLEFFTTRGGEFGPPNEWWAPYNFYLGDILPAPNVLYAQGVTVDDTFYPKPTAVEMTDNILSIRNNSRPTVLEVVGGGGGGGGGIVGCVGKYCRNFFYPPNTKKNRRNRRNRRVNKTRRVRKHRRS